MRQDILFSVILNVIISNTKGPQYWNNEGQEGYWMGFDATDTTGTVRGVIFGKTLKEVEQTSGNFISQKKLKIINPKVVLKKAGFDSDNLYPFNVEIRIHSYTRVTSSTKRLKFDELV